jgi:hypothetical protein
MRDYKSEIKQVGTWCRIFNVDGSPVMETDPVTMKQRQRVELLGMKGRDLLRDLGYKAEPVVDSTIDRKDME